MGKQKIVIQIKMENLEKRSKVQRKVVKHRGVTSVKIEGDDHDKVVIEGDGIDVVKITEALRGRIFRVSARVLTVETIDKEKEKKEKEEKKKKEDAQLIEYARNLYPPLYNRYSTYEIPYDQNSCCVM